MIGVRHFARGAGILRDFCIRFHTGLIMENALAGGFAFLNHCVIGGRCGNYFVGSQNLNRK